MGVDRFWQNIRNKYKYHEFVKDWNKNWGGIGVLFIEK